MAKNKTLKVLSTGTVAGMIAAAVLSSQAFAAVDAYSVKIGEDVLKYDKAALTESFLAAKAGEAAPLYEDFTAKLTEAKGFYAFSDSKTGKFVSYSDIQAKFLAAKEAGEAFVVDAYTESVDAQVIEVPTVKKVVVKDGKVVVETEGQVTGALKINSVTATNLIEAKIVFNQEVDETSAETTGNYAVSGLTVSSATLESDNKTVTLKYAAAMTNYDEYTIVVEKVKNKAGVEIEDTTVKYTVSDVAIPTATITAKGNKVIEIAFSEPVQNALALTGNNLENITINGNNIDTTVDSAVLNAAGTKLTLTFANPLVAGEIKVKIAANGTTDIADYAGYKVAPIEAKINVLPASDMPNVQTVTFNDQTKVTVKFEKGMAISTTGDLAKFYWNTTGNAADNSKTADSIKKVDDQTWEIKFTAANKPLPVGTVYFFVKDTVDYSDNKIIGNTTTANTFKSTLTVVANATPKATSVTSAKDTEIKVKFNNDMNETEAEKKSNYVLKDSDGEIVSLSGATLDYVVNDKELTMTFGSALSGNYTLTVKAIKDVVDVKTVESTYSVAVNDTTAPTVVGTPAWKGDTIIVTFNEKVATSGTYSALNVDNYKFNGDKLPAGTTLSLLEGGKKVKITRPSGTWTAGQNLTVGYFDATTIKTVSDLKGNLLNPASIALGAQDVSVIDLVGSTSKLVSTTKVEVTTAAGKPEWASIVASDFTVNGKTVVTASIDKDNARKIYLEVAEDDKFNAGTTGITIATKNQTMSSKDVFGAIIAQNSTVVLGANDIKPELVGAVVTGDNTISVQFDTYMESGTYANMKNDLIFVQGDKTYKASDIATVLDYAGNAADSKVVVFTFANSELNIAEPVTVKTIGQDFITTTGANTAKLTANTTGITSAELATTAISIANNGVANAVDAGDVITISFNRNIDFKSIEDRDWATALTGVTATFDASDDTVVFDGVELGTLSGLNITADGTATVTITKVNDRQLTVTVTGVTGAATGALTAGTQVKFEASSSIKSAQGVSIDENFDPVTGTNF